MKLFCVNLSWSYSPFKIPRKNHTSSVQILSWTCAHYYSLPWNNLVSQWLVGNSEDFDISAGSELPGNLLQSDLFFFLGARILTTLLSFYDPQKLHLVWFSFYKRCSSNILQQRSFKSTRQLSPMYTNLQMNVF